MGGSRRRAAAGRQSRRVDSRTVKAGTLVQGGVRLKNCYGIAARTLSSGCLAAILVLFGARGLQNAIADGDTRTISLHHIHTGEDITVTFKRDGRYDDAALQKLDWFLRDWRREEETRVDPHLIDLIWEVQRETGTHEPVWVVCGYRSPETNAMLRRRSGGVARFSQHMLGRAMDFYIPGVPLEELRVIGLRLQRGGVGFYPTSGSPFVHMDTGGVRHWPRMTREQLVRIFPDGRTVHIPTDGRPLPGYALALADIRNGGGHPSDVSLEAARNAGVAVADASLGRRLVNPFAKLFGLARDDDDEDAGAAPVFVTATAAPAAAAAPLPKRAKAAVAAALNRAEHKVAAERAKLVRVAARVEQKLSADRAKLVRAAAKVPIIRRAEAAPSGELTPKQIILARGFWQGVPDGVATTRSIASANPLDAFVHAKGGDGEATGSLSPFAAAPADRVPPAMALAYAEQPGGEMRSPADAAAIELTGARATVTHAVAVQTGGGEMTVAMKRVSGRPASAILTVGNKSSGSLGPGPLIDPWLRAVVVSPSVSNFLCLTMLGTPDFRSLAALLVKPSSSVMMTFAADPNPGLTQDRFSGGAVVFVATVTYPIRTADLRQ